MLSCIYNTTAGRVGGYFFAPGPDSCQELTTRLISCPNTARMEPSHPLHSGLSMSASPSTASTRLTGISGLDFLHTRSAEESGCSSIPLAHLYSCRCWIDETAPPDLEDDADCDAGWYGIGMYWNMLMGHPYARTKTCLPDEGTRPGPPICGR